MPYMFKVALFGVREILPSFRFPNAAFDFETWFFRRVLPKFWVMQICGLEELKSSMATGVVVVTPNIIFPEYIKTLVYRIRRSGFSRKILIFSPPGTKYQGGGKIEGVFFLDTDDMSEIINAIRTHCLLFL